MNRKARLTELERSTAQRRRGPYVLIRPGQTKAEALAAAGLPADAPNDFLMTREEGQ